MTKSLKNQNILISGGGVAGPALAYWLHRHGFSPTIVERAPDVRDGGHAVDFRGPAHLGLLERMGLLDRIKAEQTNMGATAYVDERGRRLYDMPADLFAGDVEILRGDLGRILYEETEPYTEYIFGDSITAIAEDAEGVDVTFDSGMTRRFDLVAGADGLHSNVRRLAFGPESRYVRHEGVHVAVFSFDNYLGLDYSGLAHVKVGKVAGVYSYRHNTEARAMFFFGAPELEYDRRDVAAQKKIVAEAFAGAGWEVPRLLERMWDSPSWYFDSVALVRMEDGWSRGRTVLLGDAAYCASPLSGMGTGLAMVGAYVLAGELAAAGGDHAAGFAAYEEALGDYARGCQKQGEGVAKMMVPENRFVGWLMGQNMKLLPYMPWRGAIAKGVRKVAGAIELKDY